MKQCSRCLEFKTTEQFTKSKQLKDGLNCWCINCTRESGRLSYLKNKRKVISRVKKYRQSKKGKEVSKLATSKWKEKNPKKYIVHKIIDMAMRYGVISIKPCEKCGESKRLHAHHEDYNKPFDIIWLCPLHHKLYHLNEK